MRDDEVTVTSHTIQANELDWGALKSTINAWKPPVYKTLDLDKVKTVEDVVMVLKALYQGTGIGIEESKSESYKHLLKDEE